MANDAVVIIGTKLDTKDFEAEIAYVERKLDDMIADYQTLSTEKGFNEQSSQAIELRYNIQKVSNHLNDLKEKQDKINQNGMTSFRDVIENIGKSTEKVVKKIGQWALAVFGIHGAYMAVRNAINVISQNDEQLASDIEYMKTALAYTIEPVVRGIVDLMKQLMSYVGYIVYNWTNGKVNIFESANKSLNNANKNAQKLSKTLAGFDEMNVISDNSVSGGGAITTGMDLSEIPTDEDMEGTFIGWIAKNKDKVIGALLRIGTAIGLIKLVDLIGGFSTLWGILKPFMTFVGKNATVISGIILIIGGLVIAIQRIIDYFKEPTWENFGQILLGIGIIAGGVLVIFGGFPALITLIVGAIVAFGIAIYKNWDKIKEWTLELVEKIKKGFGDAIQWVKDKFNAMVSFFSGLISKIVGLFKTIGTKVGDAIGGAFKTVINGVLKATENILNSPIKAVNSLIGVINKIPGINLGSLPTFSLPRLAVGGIVNMPGRGVNYMGANIAERGPEGVIPLTNSQMMSELGKAIGQYVTINANITNTMNGRVISRELQKINTNSDFAFNR